MSNVAQGDPMGGEGCGEILARLGPTDHEDVRPLDPVPDLGGLDGSGRGGGEAGIDGLADDADARLPHAGLLQFGGDGLAEGHDGVGAPGGSDDEPRVRAHRVRIPLGPQQHREVVDGNDAATGEDGRGVGQREHAATAGESRKNGLLEEMVPGPARRSPDVTVDARIADPPRRHDESIEPGLAGRIQQRTPDAMQAGGPRAQEAPVDDEHDVILAVHPANSPAVRAVSIVIPVRNGARTLPACLDAVARQEPIPDVTVELIVVDNGSSDASREFAESHPAVTRVITETRPGSYAARNAGLAVASGDVIAFTDADCVPAADWLRAGIEALAEGVDLVAGHVTPRLSHAPSVWERFDAGHHVDQRKYVELMGFGATANLFVRSIVLAGVGTFDGAMGSGGDRELCRRAVHAGFRLAYSPDAVVMHGSRRTARETWRLHRRLGAGLRQLHERGLHPPWWRDDQMLLPLGWAAEVASDQTRRYRHREMVPLAALVVGARAFGRLTGR